MNNDLNIQIQELSKIVLLSYIAEQIVNNNSEQFVQYPKLRESLDFCWEWIEQKEVDIDKIYEFLDDEDENDLVGYMLYSKEEIEKKELSALLGIVSYISYNILTIKKEPIPQFLEIDEEYYNSLMNDMSTLNISNYDTEIINKIIKYCENQISMKKEHFNRTEFEKYLRIG